MHAQMIYCCLTISGKVYYKLFTRAICDTIASSQRTLHQANFHAPRYALLKRYYSEDNQNTAKNERLLEDEPQKDKYEVELEKYLACPENMRKYKLLELEIDVMRHDFRKVPDVIPPKAWLQLLQLGTKSQRIKHLTFLWVNERRNLSDKARKEQKKQQWLSQQDEPKIINEIEYGLQYNTLFMRIYNKTINQFYNRQMIEAMMFNPKIVFDCSYDKHMSAPEANNCAKQIVFAFSHNRSHRVPFDIHLCNFNAKDRVGQAIERFIPTLYDDTFPINVTSQSYLDVFDRKDLVYLTPHCHTSLNAYDPDKTYIIGAMVDKSNPKPLSSAKAKKEGIKMAKLPLELLPWGPGSGKNLTINQVLAIMLDMNLTKDWKIALKHVPLRKLKDYAYHKLEEKIAHCNEMQTNDNYSNRYVNNMKGINIQ